MPTTVLRAPLPPGFSDLATAGGPAASTKRFFIHMANLFEMKTPSEINPPFSIFEILLDKENELPEFAQLCGFLLGSKWEYVCAGFSLVAVLGVAIVYWILMSNFLRNTLEFGQGTYL